MRRASEIRKAGAWDPAHARDAVSLDADDRHRRRIALTSANGTRFMLDLPEAASLRNGDGLVLDDGSIVRVDGKPEPLVEISAADAPALARLSWHLGNRHTEMQITGDRLRIRRDHVLEEMLTLLGATLTPVDAVFEPEHGAYGHSHGTAAAHGHDHLPGPVNEPRQGHGHARDHGHEHGHYDE